MDEQQSGGISAWITEHAPLAILIAVVGAIILFAFLTNRKNNQAATSQGDTATGDLSGLMTDANGNHIVYLPVQDYFNNISTVTGSYNPVSTTTNTATTTDTSVVNPPPPPPTTTVQPPPAIGTTIAWIAKYTVKAGDTLSSVAEAVGDRGTQTTGTAIYAHNQHTIDSMVHAKNGHSMQLYPGTVLTVPVVVTRGTKQPLPFESGVPLISQGSN